MNARRADQHRQARRDRYGQPPHNKQRGAAALRLQLVDHGHGVAAERNNVRDTGLPMLMLKPSMCCASV